MRRILVFALLTAATTAGCGPTSHPRAVPGTGIEGRVTVGPTCPVERVGTPCPPAPLSAVIIVRDSTGAKVARVASGKDGLFRVDLPPGTYTLDPQSPGPAGLPRGEPQTVEVRRGAYTHAEVHYDSGIR
jgi:hypothetical protein